MIEAILARHDAGLSQSELAWRAGTSQATLSAYEAGPKSPSFETLVRIIRAAGQDLRVRLEPLDDHDEWVRGVRGEPPARAGRGTGPQPEPGEIED